MGRFKKGTVLGGILGAGIMWLFTTKKGREVRSQIIDIAAKLYPQVKQKVTSSGGWKKMNKSKYMKIVQEVVDKYAVKTGLSKKTKTMVTKLLNSQFKK